MLLWGEGAHTVNLFVLSVAKSRALNSRFVEGVERRLPSERGRGWRRGTDPKGITTSQVKPNAKTAKKNIYQNPTRKPQPAPVMCGPFFLYYFIPSLVLSSF